VGIARCPPACLDLGFQQQQSFAFRKETESPAEHNPSPGPPVRPDNTSPQCGPGRFDFADIQTKARVIIASPSSAESAEFSASKNCAFRSRRSGSCGCIASDCSRSRGRLPVFAGPGIKQFAAFFKTVKIHSALARLRSRILTGLPGLSEYRQTNLRPAGKLSRLY